MVQVTLYCWPPGRKMEVGIRREGRDGVEEEM